MRHILTVALIAGLFAMNSADADCVYGAKDKTSFVILDSHTILLRGGGGSDILIKSYSFFHSTSEVAVLKDDFCSFDDAVLYVDGDVVDASNVKRVD